MNNYNLFKKREQIKKIILLLSQILLFVLFLIIWQYSSNRNYINSFITSSPKNILNTLINLYKDNNLLYHIIVTIKETTIAFTITSVLSIIISILLYNFKYLAKLIDPYLTIFNSMPKVALGPIIIIWLGANTKSIIVMAILISIIVSIQNIYIGFSHTNENRIKLLKTFNASKKDILFNLVIRENKHVILNTLKINISMCLIGVITGEFLTSKAGIGYLILYGSQVFNLNLVMTGIFILIIISFVMYELIIILTKNKD